MKLFKLIGLLSVLIVGTSCDPAKEFKTEITEIDSCITAIEEMESRLEGINFDSLMIMVNHVKQNEGQLQLYYRPDTLNEELGSLMNECKGIRKQMSNSGGKQLLYTDEMNAVKHQLWI